MHTFSNLSLACFKKAHSMNEILKQIHDYLNEYSLLNWLWDTGHISNVQYFDQVYRIETKNYLFCLQKIMELKSDEHSKFRRF